MHIGKACAIEILSNGLIISHDVQWMIDFGVGTLSKEISLGSTKLSVPATQTAKLLTKHLLFVLSPALESKSNSNQYYKILLIFLEKYWHLQVTER